MCQIGVQSFLKRKKKELQMDTCRLAPRGIIPGPGGRQAYGVGGRDMPRTAQDP